VIERVRRRDVIRGAGALGSALAGCVAPSAGDGTLLAESFEGGLDGWETAAAAGPEVPPGGFNWAIRRSRDRAAAGEWSLEVFTEGDHDDGTAWAVTELPPPTGDGGFEASVSAWSPSESFNTLRHLVAYLGPERPTAEADFPDPGANSTAVPGAPFGGLREPLHLAAGWREYRFEWDPPEAPDALYLAVGVSVVWESDATHYLDSVAVRRA
jgi:hypothetical protein